MTSSLFVKPALLNFLIAHVLVRALEAKISRCRLTFGMFERLKPKIFMWFVLLTSWPPALMKTLFSQETTSDTRKRLVLASFTTIPHSVARAATCWKSDSDLAACTSLNFSPLSSKAEVYFFEEYPVVYIFVDFRSAVLPGWLVP